MALPKPVLAIVFLFLFFEKQAESGESPASSDNEDTSSIPMIASGKRQHNIMRFGKRPAGGHNLIHFGKRENSKPQHSFLYFGKRLSEEESLPDLIQYLQRNRDNSYKRGHSIMRFGKRTPGNHNFIRFGRGDADEDYEEYYPDDSDMDETKRGGHNMMYFGKRGGHAMMYFGKRASGHNMLSFGKRDDDKRAHSMIHFGKRDYDDDGVDSDEKRAHSMIHFGKREDDDDTYPDEPKRAHSMIHFGKREDDDDTYPDELKRAHSMIHFGKRDYDDEPLPFLLNPAAIDKKQHNLLRFGKKMGSHAMIHFGKRDEDKRAAHTMIHFGKRSVDQDIETVQKNGTGNQKQAPTQAITRMKRDVEEPLESSEPLSGLVHFGNNEDDEDIVPEEELENAIKASHASIYRTGEMFNYIPYPDVEQSILPLYTDYQPLHKKESSKNVFLRFG